jgi:hypothetical protein
VFRHHLEIVCLSAVLAIAALAGCGEAVGPSGTSVGAACAGNDECSPQSRCLIGGDFPGGMCTVNCADHDDCPSGSKCIKKEGGVCLPACEVPGDCRGGYTCKAKDNQFTGGQSLVCIE